MVKLLPMPEMAAKAVNYEEWFKCNVQIWYAL
jgi:hypothetical protein